jgi:ferredoxin
MRVSVDQALCQGHAQCEETAPEIFLVNADGKADVLIPNPADGHRPAVLEAVRRCPAEAITADEA